MSLMGQIDKVDLPIGKAEVLPSGFTGIVSKAARQTWLNFNSYSSNNALAEADEWQAQQYEDATGRNISELYPTPMDYQEAGADLATLQQRRDFINSKLDVLRAADPTLADVATTGQVDEQAKEIANKSTRDLQEAQYYSRSDWPLTAGLVGGLGGAIVDPINLAVMPFGGGGKTVLQLMMREAALGAATEVALHPAIADWQKRLGNEYGLDDLATNMIFAAVGGAGLSGAVGGASVAFNRAANHFKDNEVLNAGLKVLSEDAHLRENDPSTTVYGSKTHLEAVDFGQRALENGYIPDSKTVSRGNELDFVVMQDVEHVLMVNRARDEGVDFNTKDLERFIAAELQKTEPMFKPVDLTGRKFVDHVEADFDEIQVAIAKLGGISREIAESAGIDPAGFGAQTARIKRLFTKRGKSLDDMAESLSEHGYFKGAYTENELLEILSDSLAGLKHYTPEGFINSAKKAELDDVNIRNGEADFIDNMLANVTDDIAFSAREINADINKGPRPTQEEYSNFQQVLTDAELFPSQRTKEQIAEDLERMDSPEVDKAMEEEFARTAEAHGDDIILMEDGTAIKVSALKEQFAKDDQMLADITSCGIGGA